MFLRSSTDSGTPRAPLPEVLLCCSMGQGHRGVPLAGVLVCRLAHQVLKGAPWVGSCSVLQCIRHLMGQPLCCSAAYSVVQMLVCCEREAMVMCHSAVSCFHGCLAFLHRDFPPQSPPSPPLSICLQSMAAFALGLFYNP